MRTHKIQSEPATPTVLMSSGRGASRPLIPRKRGLEAYATTVTGLTQLSLGLFSMPCQRWASLAVPRIRRVTRCDVLVI